MTAETIIGLYERHARAWVADRGRQTRLFEKAWLDRFIALVPSGGTVLDLGCGSGKPITEYLVSQGLAVCGVDSSPTMISLARSNLPDQRWILGDMRQLALGEQFAGIVAWDSFFHLDFEAQRRMFAIFRDHAAARAPLLFTSGPEHGEAIGTLEGEPLYHASLSQEEYRSLLSTHGFTVVCERMEDPDCGGHSVWLARRSETR